jgi:hypothetical protein
MERPSAQELYLARWPITRRSLPLHAVVGGGWNSAFLIGDEHMTPQIIRRLRPPSTT